MPAAKDALDYGRALEDMASTLDDSHVVVFSRALMDDRGRAGVGLRISQVEGRFIVTGLADPALRTRDGVRVGDELVTIDGKDFGVQVAALAPQVAASTAAGKIRNAIGRALGGAPGSEALLGLTDASGRARQVRARRTEDDVRVPARSEQPVAKVLEGNVGYVDLDRLAPAEVDAMFEKIGNTVSLIFDMRGYPHGVTQAIVPRLNVMGATSGAVSYQNLVTAAPIGPNVRVAYPEMFGVATLPLYRGRIFMLINEHTQSQAEYLAMNVSAAAPVTFVGTPSAGANGDLRHIVLPGNVTVSYSSLEVRHADGRQLQRLGVQPHLLAAPTVAGIRAGRDEVLERALEAARK